MRENEKSPGSGDVDHRAKEANETYSIGDQPEKASQPEPTLATVRVDSIHVDSRYQARVALDPSTVQRYRELIQSATEDGSDWPFIEPLDVAGDVLLDGFHRLQAAKLGGLATVPVRIHQCDDDQALRLVLAANTRHGLPRSQQDTRRAIRLAIERWPDLSNRAIRDLVGCSCHKTVSRERHRMRLEASGALPEPKPAAEPVASAPVHGESESFSSAFQSAIGSSPSMVRPVSSIKERASACERSLGQTARCFDSLFGDGGLNQSGSYEHQQALILIHKLGDVCSEYVEHRLASA